MSGRVGIHNKGKEKILIQMLWLIEEKLQKE